MFVLFLITLLGIYIITQLIKIPIGNGYITNKISNNRIVVFFPKTEKVATLRAIPSFYKKYKKGSKYFIVSLNTVIYIFLFYLLIVILKYYGNSI